MSFSIYVSRRRSFNRILMRSELLKNSFYALEGKDLKTHHDMCYKVPLPLLLFSLNDEFYECLKIYIFYHIDRLINSLLFSHRTFYFKFIKRKNPFHLLFN